MLSLNAITCIAQAAVLCADPLAALGDVLMCVKESTRMLDSIMCEAAQRGSP